MLRALFVLLVLGWTISSEAQTPARNPHTLSGGVCGTTNWVCVAECLDAACVDQCLREGCEQALGVLQECTQRAGCTQDDSACSARACGDTCQKAFEPAPPSPEQENTQPCQGFRPEEVGKVPEKVVGRWELAAATLTAEPKENPAQAEPKPRSDYARSLEVTPEGCFVMSTALEEATLGRGNSLQVRSWGSFVVTGEDTVTLRTKDGQVVGPVCGKPRVIGLSKGRFKGARYTFNVQDGALTFIMNDTAKHTFQFQRPKTEPPKESSKKKK